MLHRQLRQATIKILKKMFSTANKNVERADSCFIDSSVNDQIGVPPVYNALVPNQEK